MSSLTIVVPRIGPDAAFETTLASVLRYRLPHHQVIVVQGLDAADDYGLADEVLFLTCVATPDLAACLNRAVPFASGEVIHLLFPGVEVRHQWFAPSMRLLRRQEVGCVSIPLAFDDRPEEIVSRGLAIDRGGGLFHVKDSKGAVGGPAHWAASFRRSVLEEIGPLSGEFPDALLGLETGLRAAGCGYHCVVADECPVTIIANQSIRLASGYGIGYCGQRLHHRFGKSGNLFSMMASWFHIASLLVQPAQWPVLAGRIAAQRCKNDDLQYAARGAQSAVQHAHQDTHGSGGHRAGRNAA